MPEIPYTGIQEYVDIDIFDERNEMHQSMEVVGCCCMFRQTAGFVPHMFGPYRRRGQVAESAERC